MRARICTGAVAVALSLALPAAARAQGAAPFAWMAGCWEQRTERRVVQESWFTPAAGGMIGMSRTLRRGTGAAAADSMVEFEFLRLVQRAGAWTYAAQPSGRPPTDFAAEAVTDTSATFVNAANDFPQRITYRRVGADSLLARIEGNVRGQVRAIAFPYARVACDGAVRD